MPPVKLCVFDMAGTVVNEHNVVYQCIHRSLGEAGFAFSVEEVLACGAGKEKHQAIRDILAYAGIHHVDTRLIFEHFQAILDAAYEDLQVTPFEDVTRLFATLREQGVMIALDTGYSTRIALRLLAKMGWREGVEYDTLVSADQVQRGRPYPDMIHLCMARLGVVDPRSVLKIGDSCIDIEEGKNAGCAWSIGVTTGAQTREQLRASEPDAIVDQLSDILRYTGVS